MNSSKKLIAASALLCLVNTGPSFAQNGSSYSLEEITVTGRKREESLQEVPISISVLSSSLISDAGIVDQQDLFDLVPGIHYDEAIDRNSALASVRGVQSNEVATNRTKVTAFIDGMPILGSQGSIQVGNVDQIEVYRGPQSAAFGRSTFGGAINYITADPGEEFEGSVNVDINDYGRRIVRGSVSGPMTDRIGYLIEGTKEDSDAPSDWIATDGTEYGTRGTEYLSGKFVFNPTDALEIEFAVSRVETEDGPTAGYFISQEARDACWDGTVSSGMGGGVYGQGTIDCDWSQGAQIAAQHDRTALMIANGETDEDRLFLAAAQSVPADQVGSFDTRDRATIQVDYSLDSGAAVQFSGFVGEEDYIRQSDNSRNADDEINIAFNPGTGFWDVTTGGPMATLGVVMSDPTSIEEQYAELRWVSPADERLRYIVGASYYDYEFLTVIYFGGYSAIQQGQAVIDRYDALVGNTGDTSLSNPRQVFSETATNTGLYFNTAYDVTDQFTLTFEGRYQSDETGGADFTSGESGSVTTKAFLPRLSFNYNITDDMSFYGQLAKGNNPGGVNVGFFNPANIDTLDNGVPNGRGVDRDGNVAAGCSGPVPADPTNDQIADDDCRSFYVDYDSSSFVGFDEEELINVEFGLKGSAFDSRLQYSAAIFRMDWTDQAQSVNLDWDDPDGVVGIDSTTNRTFINEGDLTLQGLEFEGNLAATENITIRGTFSYLDAVYDSYCSVGLIGSGLETISGAEIVDTGTFTCADISGNEVAEQPEITMSLSPTYSTDVGNGLNLNVRGDFRYEGAQWIDAANVGKRKAVPTLNLAVGLRADQWDATLYVNNVTDNDSPLDIGANDDFTIDAATSITGDQSNYLITPRAPRTIGVRASYRF